MIYEVLKCERNKKVSMKYGNSGCSEEDMSFLHNLQLQVLTVGAPPQAEQMGKNLSMKPLIWSPEGGGGVWVDWKAARRPKTSTSGLMLCVACGYLQTEVMTAVSSVL